LSREHAQREREAFRRLSDMRKAIPRACALETCDRVFTPATVWQAYCSEGCRQAAYYRRKGEKG
jgi:hypothetical protein